MSPAPVSSLVSVSLTRLPPTMCDTHMTQHKHRCADAQPEEKAHPNHHRDRHTHRKLQSVLRVNAGAIHQTLMRIKHTRARTETREQRHAKTSPSTTHTTSTHAHQCWRTNTKPNKIQYAHKNRNNKRGTG